MKAQRNLILIALLASLTMHLVYGIEDERQIGELQYKLDHQEAIIQDRDEQIKIMDMLLDQKVVPESKPTAKETYIGEEYTITAYCGCKECCGDWALNRPDEIVYGASGIELTEGVSVASPLPFGTEIIIDDQTYISQDRTAKWIAEKYNNKIIDLYFLKHEDAEKFGKQIKKIRILEVNK